MERKDVADYSDSGMIHTNDEHVQNRNHPALGRGEYRNRYEDMHFRKVAIGVTRSRTLHAAHCVMKDAEDSRNLWPDPRRAARFS